MSQTVSLAGTALETGPGGPQVAYHPTQSAGFSMRMRLASLAWRLVNITVFRFSPKPFRAFRRALLRAFGAQLGRGASVHNTARIDCPWNLRMGICASVGEHAWVYALDKIAIADYACVGQHAFLLTGTHDYNDPGFPLRTRPVSVEAGAWLAARCTVLPGVRIGAYTVVGAGSVVSKPLPGGMVCGGNPCAVLRKRNLPGLHG
jgi:putative colanic acid biosynthesis acetyltransferase WcaF